jgi:hypothetical protein
MKNILVTGAIELMLKYKKTPNHYSPDAVKSWNLRLPVESDILTNVLSLNPEYLTIADGIPAVLDDCLCFTWCPSNLDNSSNLTIPLDVEPAMITIGDLKAHFDKRLCQRKKGGPNGN